MDRLSELKDYMEEHILDRINAHITAEQKYMYQNADEVKNRIILKIRKIQSGNKEVDKVIICYLYSSIAMKKNELCLIPFANLPFAEQPENEVYMAYSEILKTPFMEEKYFERILREKYVQLLPYEVEEIRREYMYRYSEKIGDLLSELLSSCESGIRVFYGAYMEKVKEIGRVAL